MANANLLDVLAKQGRTRTISNIVVFGRVRCAIQKPEILGDLEVDNGIFAIIDAYAFKCLGEDYFGSGGIYDANRVYFTKGSMVIFIDNKKWIGKDVKVYGTSTRRGVNIKQRFKRKTAYDGIAAFAFMPSGNTFKVVPNKLVELGHTDADIRGTALEDFIVSVVLEKEGVVQYPVTLDSIMGYEGVIDYEELDESEVEDAFNFDSSQDKIDVTKIDMHLTYHLDGAEISSLYDDFKEEIDVMSQKRKRYVSDLLKNIDEIYTKEYDSEGFDFEELGYTGNKDLLCMYSVPSDIRTKFVYQIATNYDNILGYSKVRGGYFVDELLKIAQTFCNSDVDKDVKKNLKNLVESLAGVVRLDPTILSGNSGSEYDEIPLLSDDMEFAIAVISVLTGISYDKLSNNSTWCGVYFGMNKNLWFYSLIRYPYLLGMLCNSLTLVDCDIIYLSFTKYYQKDCLKKENMDMRANLLFLETLNSASDKDTLIAEWSLKSKQAKYPAIGERYLKTHGFPIKADYLSALNVFFGKDISLSSRDAEALIKSNWFTKERKDLLVDKGIVNLINNDLILESDLEKEFFIYKTLIRKGHEETGVTQENIDRVICDFEEDKGFKLEALQKDGIQLIKYKAAVLSGCAGSGKTTTSDCMVEGLKTLEDFEKKYELIYCTPTGKACRRLAEVLKGTVRTIHCQFGVGIGGTSYIMPVTSKYRQVEKIKIYMMDEMAMCSMPLLFEICRNLGPGDLIYFLGDCKQLPPIGKGNPFALLMKILPCIELGVSKRAAEGSDINYNTTLVNCVSDGYVKELSYNNKDFMYRECADAMIPGVVTNVWRQFMEGSMNGTQYEEDAIQVITGYQKEDISFSAPMLNPPLQRLLRKNDKLLFRHVNREFYMNERVIHLNSNDYSMCRYAEVSPGMFECLATTGIVNGEMGKLVGIIRSDMATIMEFDAASCISGEGHYRNVSEENLAEIIKKREEKEDALRDDTKTKSNRQYFVKVKVYDVELGIDVIVLYRATAHQVEGITILEGMDLSNIDLAYALTTHKMQGSQSQVVILPFGSKCNPRFINRNMINTMITRSQKAVCLVGTILGEDSPVSQGRQYTSPIQCNDVLSLLSK